MTETSLLRAALAYSAAGVSVVPVAGKAAVVSWKPYQSRRPVDSELRYWFTSAKATGLAIVSGGVSRGLVIIDLDGLTAAQAFGQQWPHLRDTLIVRSGGGWHCYYHVDRLPDAVRLVNGPNGIKEIGIRADGHYTVAPPSRHPGGSWYYPLRRREPLHVPNLDPVADWLRSMRWVNTNPTRPTAPVPRVQTGDCINPAYVNSVLQRELDYVATARQGTRNDNLFHAARRLAGLAAAPGSGLDAERVRAQLAAAAAHLAATDGHESVARTINSGWDRGWREPKQIPEANLG